MAESDNIEDIPLEGVHYAPNEGKMNELKESANKMFAEKKYEEALKEYSNALCYGENAIIHANRAFCWLKLDMYGAALTDAQKSIELDPNYAKGMRLFVLKMFKLTDREREQTRVSHDKRHFLGYYRRAAANYSLAKYKDALADFRQVVRLAPKGSLFLLFEILNFLSMFCSCQTEELVIEQQNVIS